MTKLNNTQMAPAAAAIFAIVAGASMNIVYAGYLGRTKVAAWLITMAMIGLLCGCIGRAITGRWDGVLIDGRNRIALSRLQMFAWTLLILSTLITAVASNLATTQSTAAFGITIWDELLVAMGISTVSLAATPALLTLKENASPGTVAARDDTQKPSWLDIFRGDGTDEEMKPDLSKIQQFLITLSIVGGYAVAIGYLMYHLGPDARFTQFPPLDPKFIWLLGISHAGYLTYKAAPRPSATH
jgi:hypothetical protein